MKRSVVFLGICLAISAGLAIAQDAKSSAKAAADFCCNQTTLRCKKGDLPGWSYGPAATRIEDCVEF